MGAPTPGQDWPHTSRGHGYDGRGPLVADCAECSSPQAIAARRVERKRAGYRHSVARREASAMRSRAYGHHSEHAWITERLFGSPPWPRWPKSSGPYPTADELAAFRAELCGCPGWNGESHAEACPLREPDELCPCGYAFGRGDRQDDAHELHCCPVCYRDMLECGGHTMARPLTDPERAALARSGPVAQPCEACGAPAPHLCDCTP